MMSDQVENFFFNIFDNAADKKGTYGILRYQFFSYPDYNQDLEHFHNILGFI